MSSQAAAAVFHADAFAGLSLFTHGLADPLQFEGHLFVGGDNLVEVVGNLARQPGP